LESLTASGQLQILIKDNGCGMSDDVKKHMFEAFFTTKGADKGTGLGMKICRGIVETHGGTIQFESTLGEGTCFSLRFPLSAPPPG
jgi:signal transduction histidine kinase